MPEPKVQSVRLLNEGISPREKFESRKILVTGGRGRLAIPILKQLATCGQVMATDLTPASPMDSPESYRQADLEDFSQVTALMSGVDTVVHLAVASSKDYPADMEVEPSRLHPYTALMLRVNPTITYNIFEAARHAGVRRIVYASSLTIYFGDKTLPVFHETDYPNPANLYACTKLFGESLARIYHRDFGLDALSLRIGQPFPGHAQHDLTWRTNRRARSTYVTLEDLGRAMAAAVTTPEKYGIFNVVSDSDNPRFDLTATQQLGYVPTGRFTEEGLYHRNNEAEAWQMISPTESPSITQPL